MNNAFEACRSCQVQCKLEDKSEAIVVKATEESLQVKQVRGIISLMSQDASQRGCPSSEIQRVKTETATKVDPKLGRRWQKSLAIAEKPPLEYTQMLYRKGHNLV